MEKLIAEETPHETTAHRGDCVFYHHRIVHSAGVNRTGFGPKPWIRKAALCDFMRADRPMKDELPLEMSSYRKVAERAAAGNHKPGPLPPFLRPSSAPRGSAALCLHLSVWRCVAGKARETDSWKLWMMHTRGAPPSLPLSRPPHRLTDLHRGGLRVR